MGLATKLRDIVDRSFTVSQLTYAAALSAHNAMLGLDGDLAFRPEVRPKFFTGNPDALLPGGYLLALSLNHKYAPGPGISGELDALNAGPAEHYVSCVNYFKRYRPYRFYTNFAPVLRGMGLKAPELGKHVFFMDALPFFSARSRPLTPADLRRMGGGLVELNREAIRAVVTEAPPAALFVNGRTAYSALEAWSDGPVKWRSHVLAGRTSVGPCTVEVAQVSLFGVTARAVRSNFLRSVYGPNSNEQCLELGELLGATGPLATRDGASA